jgi:hypothetical protein
MTVMVEQNISTMGGKKMFEELKQNFVLLHKKYIENDNCNDKSFFLILLLISIYFGKQTGIITTNNLGELKNEVKKLLKGGTLNKTNGKTKKRMHGKNGKTKKRMHGKNGKTKKRMHGGNNLFSFLISLGVVIFLVFIKSADAGINNAGINKNELLETVNKMFSGNNLGERFITNDNAFGKCSMQASWYSGFSNVREDFEKGIMHVHNKNKVYTPKFWPVMGDLFNQNIYDAVFYDTAWDNSLKGAKPLVDVVQQYFVDERNHAVKTGIIGKDQYATAMLSMSGHIMAAYITPNGGFIIFEPDRWVNSVVDWKLYGIKDAHKNFMFQYKPPLDGNTEDWEFWNHNLPGAFGESDRDGVTEFIANQSNGKELKLHLRGNIEPGVQLSGAIVTNADVNANVNDKISVLADYYDKHIKEIPKVKEIKKSVIYKKDNIYSRLTSVKVNNPIQPPSEISDNLILTGKETTPYNENKFIMLVAAFDNLSIKGALPANPNIDVNNVLLIPPNLMNNNKVIQVKNKVGKAISDSNTQQRQIFLITQFHDYIETIDEYPDWAETKINIYLTPPPGREN